jgi:hypothetical protein
VADSEVWLAVAGTENDDENRLTTDAGMVSTTVDAADAAAAAEGDDGDEIDAWVV